MDLTGAVWRTSSSSSGNGGACVEIAFVPGSKEGSDRVIAMRDGKRPDGTAISTHMPWELFRNMNDVELKAIWTYLQTLPASAKGVK